MKCRSWPTPTIGRSLPSRSPTASCSTAMPSKSSVLRRPTRFRASEYHRRLRRPNQARMNRKTFAAAVILFTTCSLAWADEATELAQQKLKDQGFYYGEITGKQDADTTAAIRRYQIRNGLQITGNLNPETLKA